MAWHKGQELPDEASNGNTGTPLPGSRSSCKINPILQREQRLQKYANTHPLRIQKAELADHRKKDHLVLAESELYLAPGPEKLLRGRVRSSRGVASLTFNVRPATSLPLRPVMAWAASLSSAISTKAKPRGRPVSRSLITEMLAISPKGSNKFRRSPSVVSKFKLPT